MGTVTWGWHLVFRAHCEDQGQVTPLLSELRPSFLGFRMTQKAKVSLCPEGHGGGYPRDNLGSLPSWASPFCFHLPGPPRVSVRIRKLAARHSLPRLSLSQANLQGCFFLPEGITAADVICKRLQEAPAWGLCALHFAASSDN